MAKGTFLQLQKLYQLRPYLDDRNLMTVTHALVTSRIIIAMRSTWAAFEDGPVIATGAE